MIVLAPVINLSGAQDFDPLKVTDLIASEFACVPGVTVIPVNRTLAELARCGKTAVETPADAVTLAQTFGADATVVVAVTEYDPYEPPVMGLIMQWYGPVPSSGGEAGSTAESRLPPEAGPGLSGGSGPAPQWQIQRVFNAADKQVLKELRAFAAQRDGHWSPYAWRRYLKSQELYVRFCSWALIRPMSLLNGRASVEPDEADL